MREYSMPCGCGASVEKKTFTNFTSQVPRQKQRTRSRSQGFVQIGRKRSASANYIFFFCHEFSSQPTSLSEESVTDALL